MDVSEFDYLVTARRIREGEFEAEPGPIRYLKVPRNVIVPTPAHAVQGAGAIQQWLEEVCGLADGDANPNSISPTGDILVFIHGYNNNLNTIMWRQRQLASDLQAEGWRGLVIGFDWPSDDDTLNYLEDRSDAAAVAIELVRRGVAIIAAGQKKNCRTNIHLLGHSTGAYVIMEAFVQAEKDGELFKGDWRIGQVAFIGGDVSASSLSATDNWSGPMFRRIMRLTNYSSSFDAVLGVSNAKRWAWRPARDASDCPWTLTRRRSMSTVVSISKAKRPPARCLHPAPIILTPGISVTASLRVIWQ